jgi:hypothetical protein
MSGFPVTSSNVPNKPQDFGYLGWTIDPTLASGTPRTLQNGVLNFARVRAVTSGPVGHLGYFVNAAGTLLTAGQSFIGLYDTGQTAAGVATLLATSADQSGVWTSPGGYSTAMTAAAVVASGGDYLVALVTNFTGTSPSFTIGGAVQFSLINMGLTGLSLRMGHDSASGQTTLPATMPAANLIAGGGSNDATFSVVLQT